MNQLSMKQPAARSSFQLTIQYFQEYLSKISLQGTGFGVDLILCRWKVTPHSAERVGVGISNAQRSVNAAQTLRGIGPSPARELRRAAENVVASEGENIRFLELFVTKLTVAV